MMEKHLPYNSDKFDFKPNHQPENVSSYHPYCTLCNCRYCRAEAKKKQEKTNVNINATK